MRMAEADEQDLHAEEFHAFAAYVAENLRTKEESARTLAGEAPVDFLSELADEPEVVEEKVRQLAEMVRSAEHFVIYTGTHALMMKMVVMMMNAILN